MTLLKIILVLILAYYLFKLFLRYVFPFLVKRYVNRAQQQFYKQQAGNTRKKSGEVNIDFTPENSNKKKNDLGEYVDFEEIDE